MKRWLPYALTAIGLVGGLAIVLVQPFPAALTYLAASVGFGVAVLGVAAMIIAHSGPDERGPDF